MPFNKGSLPNSILRYTMCMPRRLRKQILYGVFYLLVLALIGGGVYLAFFKPAISCYDKIKNQDEVEVDCGGVCSGLCVPIRAKPIESVGQILVLYPESDSMSILAQIKNPNPDYAAKYFTYAFSFYDDTNNPIRVFQGTSFMYPGETKYILVPNVPSVDFLRVEFSAENIDWVPAKNEHGAPRVSIVGPEVNPTEDGRLVIEGTIVNNDVVILVNIAVLATFGGPLGQTSGASQTEVIGLSPGEARAFSIVHPGLENIDLTATKIFIYAQRP